MSKISLSPTPNGDNNFFYMSFKQMTNEENRMDNPLEDSNIKSEFINLMHSESEKSKIESTTPPQRLFYFFGTIKQLRIKLNI